MSPGTATSPLPPLVAPGPLPLHDVAPAEVGEVPPADDGEVALDDDGDVVDGAALLLVPEEHATQTPSTQPAISMSGRRDREFMGEDTTPTVRGHRSEREPAQVKAR